MTNWKSHHWRQKWRPIVANNDAYDDADVASDHHWRPVPMTIAIGTNGDEVYHWCHWIWMHSILVTMERHLIHYFIANGVMSNLL